jgi:hypothetical protein
MRTGVYVELRAHLEALQEEREKFALERDRRYLEVSIEREKALKIKEVADLAALQLAREIQTYKDEKANELRTQIERERGNYASRGDLKALEDKIDATVKPLIEFVSRSRGGTDKWSQIVLGVGLIGTIITIIFKF